MRTKPEHSCPSAPEHFRVCKWTLVSRLPLAFIKDVLGHITCNKARPQKYQPSHYNLGRSKLIVETGITHSTLWIPSPGEEK